VRNRLWEDPHGPVRFRNSINLHMHLFVRSISQMCKQWGVYEKPFICTLAPSPHDAALRRRRRCTRFLRA